jgi:hypothetical protein
MPARGRTLKQSTTAENSILDRSKRWISAKDAQETLVKRWQDLEQALSLRIGPLGLDLEEAAQSNLSEAQTMRTVMRKIETYDRSLNNESRCIAQLRSASLTGALAKIEIALRLHYPAAGEENEWALVVSAARDLRDLARTTGPLELA